MALRVVGHEAGRDPGQFLEGWFRRGPQRRHSHHAGQAQAGGTGDLLRQERHLGRRPPRRGASPASSSRLTWMKQSKVPGGRSPIRSRPPPWPGRRPVGAGPLSGRRGRTGPRTWPFCSAAGRRNARSERSPASSAGLGRGLLVPVLADVGDTERREPPDVRGRVELGDHDERRRAAGAAARLDGQGDPLPDRGEPLCELARCAGHSTGPQSLADAQSWHQTSPAKRPVRGRGGRRTASQSRGCTGRQYSTSTPAASSWLRHRPEGPGRGFPTRWCSRWRAPRRLPPHAGRPGPHSSAPQIEGPSQARIRSAPSDFIASTAAGRTPFGGTGTARVRRRPGPGRRRRPLPHEHDRDAVRHHDSQRIPRDTMASASGTRRVPQLHGARRRRTSCRGPGS